MREFDNRSRHALLGDHFINSHNFPLESVWILLGNNRCWSLFELKGLTLGFAKPVLLNSIGTSQGILGDPGADSGDEGKSRRAEKYDTKKSKERREEPLGTMSYQTSSNGRCRSGF